MNKYMKLKVIVCYVVLKVTVRHVNNGRTDRRLYNIIRPVRILTGLEKNKEITIQGKLEISSNK